MFDPNGFMWKDKRVSDLSRKELQQALCRAISDLHGIAEARQAFRKQFPIKEGMVERLNAPNQYHGIQGEACAYVHLPKTPA